MTVRARFDGKVFVPIDPVDLKADQIVDLDIREATVAAERFGRRGSASDAVSASSRTGRRRRARARDRGGQNPARTEGIFDDLRDG